MMIAIVILGIGLIMVATMFPVAWTRARTLSETTIERSIAAGAQAKLAQSLSPTTLKPVTFKDPSTGAPLTLPALAAGGLLGDFVYGYLDDPDLSAVYDLVISPSDTRVHALNMSNLKVSDLDGPFVDEDLWALEGIAEFFKPRQAVQDLYLNLGAKSPFVSQLTFTQRIHPPLPPRPEVSDAAATAQWRDQLDQRRFVIAILHRLQNRIGPDDPDPVSLSPDARQEAQSALSRPRIFDMYYVTLRRPNPTNRYARQDPTSAPDNDPTAIDAPLPQPQALLANEDLVFPVAWRVQVDFHVAPTVYKGVTAAGTGPTGVPTEIRVPPPGSISAIAPQLFQVGTRFIDEVSGNVYRVASRRISLDGNNQIAYLTLDREVFIDDLDFPMNPPDPLLDGNVQREEQVRTVWVFPPAVDRSGDPPNFDGPSPVVSIDVRTMTLSPSN